MQLCTLLSVKTGGCPEDCAYCPQSAHYETAVIAEKTLDVEEVLDAARPRASAGATRFCMGAAWREVKDGPAFDNVLDMVRGVRALGMEACVTLGMLTDDQAERLAEAGLTAYNHNLDTSRRVLQVDHHARAPTTTGWRRSTRVRKAGITVCSGGIIGMGESIDDRCAMLLTLANLDPQPESVPINALVAAGHAARGDAAGRSAGAGAHDRHRAHPHAERAGAPVGRAAGAVARGAAAVLLRRRQLDLLRREAADDGQPRRSRRSGAAGGAGLRAAPVEVEA